MSFSGIEIIAWPNPQPDGDDVILAKIAVSADGVVDAWRVDGEGSHIVFNMNPVPDTERLDLFSLIELLAKMCRTVDADGAVIMHAMLSTSGVCPQPGGRLLISMPTPNTNPHAVGRIITVEPRPGQWPMPTFTLSVAVESADADAARAEFPHAIALDCYPTPAEAERWHAIDEWHVRMYGHGRNHWS